MGRGFLNHTTSIAAQKSIAEIQSVLIKHGARSLLMDINAERIDGLSFQIDSRQHGRLSIRLPARIDRVHEVLLRQLRAGQIRRTWRIVEDREQAERVAWRVLKDWVEAQMALLEAEQTTIEEVFLPHIITATGQTVFQAMQERNLLQEGVTIEAQI